MKSTIPAASNAPHSHASGQTSGSTDELARHIASEFGDMENLAVYRQHCEQYSEKAARRAYEETLSVPPEKLKRSRLALFIYLVKKYATEEG